MNDGALTHDLATGQTKPILYLGPPLREPHRNSPFQLSPLSSVAWIVTQQPQLARILEKYGVRYCCTGGSRSLLQACAGSGVDVHTVLNDLQAYNTEQQAVLDSDVDSLSREELLERVQQNQQRVNADVFRLSCLVNRVSNDHGSVFHELWELQGMFESFKTQWEQHLQTAEEVCPLLFHDQSQLALDHNYEPAEKRVAVWVNQRDFLLKSMTKMSDWAQHFHPAPGLCQTCRVLLSGLSELKPLLQQVLRTEEKLLWCIDVSVVSDVDSAGACSLKNEAPGR